MSQEENQKETNQHAKTWDEAISELQGFIIKSKKEEAQKAAKQEKKD